MITCFYVGRCDILDQLTCRAKTTGFHVSPRDGHVIFVSGCPILTAVNSFWYGWGQERTFTLSWRRILLKGWCQFVHVVNMTFDISLHVGGLRTGDVRAYAVIITWFFGSNRSSARNKSRGEKTSSWKTVIPDRRLGNLFQLPRRRISRMWTPSGTNTVIFLGSQNVYLNLLHEKKMSALSRTAKY